MGIHRPSSRSVIVLWVALTIVAAAWVASQFASNSPCRLNESTSACHGRRVAEANPLALVAIVAAWAIVAIVLPRWLASRRRNE